MYKLKLIKLPLVYAYKLLQSNEKLTLLKFKY